MKNILNRVLDLTTLKFYYRHLGYKLILQIILSILISVLDSLGLSMFFPLLKIVGGVTEAENNEDSKVFQILERCFELVHLKINLLNILIVLSVFFVLKGIMQYVYIVYYTKVRHGFIRNLRIKIINDINNYSYKSFVSTDIGRVQNSLTGEIDRLANAYINYFNAFQNFIFVVVYMLCVFFIDYQFAILVVIGGILTNFLFSKIFKYTKTEAEELTRKNHSFQGFVIQYVGNFKYLKATGRLMDYAEILIKNVLGVEKNGRRIGQLGGIITSVREPVLIILISFIIIVQVDLMKGSMTAVLISLMFFYRALGYLMAMQNAYNNYLGTYGSLSNIYDFLEELENDKERFSNSESIEHFENKIELQNVNFEYANGVRIIKNLNLEICSKQSIAFVGESGSGKTTLANMIAGLFSPTQGNIYIDGKNINDLKINDYRKKIGYITQESVIFNDTVFNNVTFWEKRTEATADKFNKAMETASIDRFINELPDREDTLLGNNGINLSGGQRQRISIARELYKNAEILILDEATSALDTETEKEIQANIDLIKGKYTLIIIAHRLSTVKNVDKIILMNKGEIMESGNFEELMKKSEKFRTMVTLQDFN